MSRFYRCTPVQRVLAAVWLVLLTYCATFQIIHTHVSSSLGFCISESAFSYDTSDSSAHHMHQDDECLICQLQRHLSTNILPDKPRILELPETQLLHFVQSIRGHRLSYVAPIRGRAPPLIFLA